MSSRVYVEEIRITASALGYIAGSKAAIRDEVVKRYPKSVRDLFPGHGAFLIKPIPEGELPAFIFMVATMMRFEHERSGVPPFSGRSAPRTRSGSFLRQSHYFGSFFSHSFLSRTTFTSGLAFCVLVGLGIAQSWPHISCGVQKRLMQGSPLVSSVLQVHDPVLRRQSFQCLMNMGQRSGVTAQSWPNEANVVFTSCADIALWDLVTAASTTSGKPTGLSLSTIARGGTPTAADKAVTS
jgi:hypothetical protein